MPAKKLRARGTSYAARYFDPNRRIAPSMDSTVVTLLRKCAFPMFHATPNLDYDNAAAVVCLLRPIRGNALNGLPSGALVRQFSASVRNLHGRQCTAYRVRGGNVF
jgi:hypothetical protein